MTKEEKTAIEGLVEEIKTLHKDMLILNKRVNYILTQVQLANAIRINNEALNGLDDDAVKFFMDIQEDYEKILKKRSVEKFKALSKALKEKEEKEKEENNNEEV